VTKKRIESTTSRTAEMNCLYRADSFPETNCHYHSDDDLAVKLLPNIFRALLHIPLFRTFFSRVIPPPGIYEYVIAQTKYIDAVFKQALAEQFDQILLFGAGFDTLTLRLQTDAQHTRVFELDVPLTQQAKIQQYKNAISASHQMWRLSRLTLIRSQWPTSWI
jgi:O-methyltransferase involved in polyketide biosynthesis